MRRIILLLTFISMIALQSCTVNETAPTPLPAPDKDTISEVFECTVSFTTTNNFSTFVTFPHTIYASDMVLAYRLSGIDSGNDVWKLLPETYYFNDGTLDFKYDFDFTKYDATIYMEGFDLPGVSTSYRTNQVFRIVVIPGYFGNKTSNNVDFSDYHAVIKAYNLDDSKIKNRN